MSAEGKKLRRLEGGQVAFWCPGCDCMHAPGVAPPASPIWGFNGNGDAPTFTPLCTGAQPAVDAARHV